MDWSGIEPDKYAETARELLIYFTVYHNTRYKEDNNGPTQNTNSPRGKKPKSNS